MKLSDVAKIINDGGIKCTCWVIPEKECEIPYAVVTKPRNGTQTYADNGLWYGSMKINLFLVIYPDDEETEYKVDEILNDNNINFTYEMYYTTEDAACVKVYTFELKED